MVDDARGSWIREQLLQVAARVRGDLRDVFAVLKKKHRNMLLSDSDITLIEQLVREAATHARGDERPAVEAPLKELAARIGIPVNGSAFGGRLDDLLRAAENRTFPLTTSLHYRLGYRRPGQGSRRPARFTVDLCTPEGVSLFDDLPSLDAMAGVTKHSAEDPPRERSRGLVRDNFLSQVEAIARIRLSTSAPGSVVERVRNAEGDGEHLRVAESHGGIARLYPVGAAASMTTGTLERFLDEVDAFYRSNDSGLISVFVYGGPPAPAPVREAAARRRVELKSFVEYQGLIDFRDDYLPSQSRRLAADRRYQAATYVPQRMRCEGSGEESSNAAATLLSWLRSPGGQFILILGDSGNGKTFLLREITRALTDDADLVPVLIELRDLEKARTVDELVAQHFARATMKVISLPAFRYMLEHGRIALLFDGFDELVLRSSYSRAADHFETILQAVGGDAKIVVTSRKQFFRADADARAALRKTAIGQRVEQVFGRRMCDLLPFDPLQIVAYLSKRFQSDEAAEDFFESLKEPLAALAANPRMLSFLADIPAGELQDSLRADPPKLTDIFEILVERWLTAEDERVTPRGALETLALQERWDAVRTLAVRLWRRGELSIDEGELGAIMSELAGGRPSRQSEPDETAFQVGSGTLLVRDEGGRFSFIHPSVMEWLVIFDASQHIAEHRSPEALAMRELTALMVLFLMQMIGHDQAVAWASEALAHAVPNEIAKTNALLVLQALGASRAAGANLVRQNLSGHDLSGQSLIEADLTAATLTGAAFTGANLTGARLLGTKAPAADFTGAILQGADVRNAAFTASRMYGADLRGIRATGASFRRCKFLTAVHDENLREGDTSGAVFSLPDELEVVVTTESRVRALAFASAGELLLGVTENVVRVWDLVAGVEVRRLHGHDDTVRSVTVHPNGRTCATCGDDGVVRIWDLATGAQTGTLRGSAQALYAVAFQPSGEFIVAAGKDGSIRVWHVDREEALHVFPAHEDTVETVSFSSDGTYFATAARDQTVALWDFAKRQLVRRTPPYEMRVRAAVIRPGTASVAIGTDSGQIWLWDARSAGSLLLGIHDDKVVGLAFAADGNQLASASDDQTARVWDMGGSDPANSELRRLKHEREVAAVAFSPVTGELVTASDGGHVPIHFWDVTRAYELRAFRDAEGFDPEFAVTKGGLLALTGVGDRTTALWDLHTSREVGRLQETHWTLNAAFSPDDRLLVTGGIAPPTLHEVSSRIRSRAIHVGDRAFWTMAFSPDGGHLAFPNDNDIEIRSVNGGELIAKLKGHTGTVWHLAFSPDGSLLVSGSSDHTTRLWYLREESRSVILPSSSNVPIRRVAFSPDGSTVASIGMYLRLWDVAATTPRDSPVNGKNGRSFAFSADGTHVAVGDFGGRIRVFDLTTGQETQNLGWHDGTVKQVAFFGDDRMIVSAAEDYTIRLWDLISQKLLGAFASFPEGWVAYDACGRYKLGGSPTGRLWHTANGCRFEAGELLPYRPDLQVAESEPFYTLP